MFVEWYALKCFTLGAVLTWWGMKKWQQYNTTKCYEIKGFTKWN